MTEKNLKYFMRDEAPEIVTAPGPNSFKDEKGNVLDFEIKVLSQEEIQKINDMYRRKGIATDKKGNPVVANGAVVWKIEKDNDKALRHIIAEALVYPNLKDEKLMDFYKCVDVAEMPLKVFRKSDEFNHVSKIVMSALGLGSGFDDDEDDKEAAKN